jgi:3-dehydroshikimate dehydratase
VSRISRNAIYDNGRDIRRCFVGGSCDPKLRTGGIVLGAAGPGDAAYEGRMGIGVVVEPGKLAHFCPDEAPKCVSAPNEALRPPAIDAVRRQGADVVVAGHFEGAAQSRFAVEVFGNRQLGGNEGAVYLGDAVAVSDADGRGRFAVTIPLAPQPGSLSSFIATLTSAAGATSEFSEPAALAQ